MSIRSRLIMFAAALVLIPVFFTPIWSINLKAPQYPDGIGMHIRINDITGHERHDIQNINIVNHYIGMKPIIPEEIPELRIMPWIFTGLILFGILTAAAGKVRLMQVWLVLFIIVTIVGMADFYMWGYDYGHNLDPRAPIKIPGESYQPPLIGTKQLLNFKASSWPHLGSLFAGISMFLGAWANWMEYKQGRNK